MTHYVHRSPEVPGCIFDHCPGPCGSLRMVLLLFFREVAGVRVCGVASGQLLGARSGAGGGGAVLYMYREKNSRYQ